MNILQRMIKDFSLFFGVGLLGKVVGFLVILFIARVFGSEILGQYSYAIAFVTIFVVVSDFNIGGMLIREIAIDKKNASKYIGNGLYIKVVLSFLAIMAIFIVSFLIDKPASVNHIIYAITIYLLFNSFNEYFYSIFKAYEKNNYVIIFKIIENFLIFALLLFLIYLKEELLVIIMGFALLSSVIFVVLASLVKKKLTYFSISKNKSVVIHLLNKSVPFGLSMIFIILFFNINILIISLVSGDRATGIYAVANNLFMGSTILFQPLISVLFPTLSRKLSEYANYNETKRQLIFRVIKYSMIIVFVGLMLAVLYLMFANSVVRILYGEEYSRSTESLKILSLIIPFWYAYLIVGIIFSSLGKHSIFTKTIIFGTIINVALGYLLIPLYNEIGAAVASLISVVLLTIIICVKMFLYLKKMDYDCEFESSLNIGFDKNGVNTNSPIDRNANIKL